MENTGPDINKRKHRRFLVELMHIQGKAVFSSKAAVNDISITGVSLITDHELKARNEYTLRLFDDRLDITLQGRVIRSRPLAPGYQSPGETPSRYLSGIQFHDLCQKTLEDLETYIKSHKTERHFDVKVHQLSGCRYSTRFHTDGRETALLDVTEHYTVQKLSMRGMQIESSHPLEPETHFHMEITLPGKRTLSFTGRVASSQPSVENPAAFDIGIEFLQMPEEDKTELKTFIKELYLQDAGF